MCLYNRMIYSPLVKCPVMGLLGQMKFLVLGPWGSATLSSTMVELIYTPTNSVKVFLLVHILFDNKKSVVSRFLDDWYSNWHEILSQYGFDLQFSNDQWWWAFFHMFLGCINVFFWKVSVRVLHPLFDGVVLFSYKSVLVLCRFWILTLCEMGRLQKNFPILLVVGSL